VALTFAANSMDVGHVVGMEVGSVVSLGVKGIIHSPVRVHLWPQTIVLPRYTTVHPILEKVTVHPALHIVTTDRSDCEARPGMMCAPHTPGGNEGMLRVHVCVKCTRLPLGRRAMMGEAVGRMLVAGVEVVRK
jgi:hypothetical protein